MSEFEQFHGEEVSCDECEWDGSATVSFHSLSGVAVFTCPKCGGQQEPA